MESKSHIEWSHYESGYWKPEKDRWHEIVVHLPVKEEEHDYRGEKKWRLVMDLLKVDGEEFALGTKIFTTTAESFASKFRGFLELAEGRGQSAIGLQLYMNKDKKYDLRMVKG